MILDPSQAAVVRAALDAGEPRALLVVEGDLCHHERRFVEGRMAYLECSNCGAESTPETGYRWNASGWLPPAVWVKLDQPCELCAATPGSTADLLADYLRDHPIAPHPDCLNGRQVHELREPCPNPYCHRGVIRQDDGRQVGYCSICSASGSVLLARATVQVLPVEIGPAKTRAPCIRMNGGWEILPPSLMDARPGVDWVVLLEFAGA